MPTGASTWAPEPIQAAHVAAPAGKGGGGYPPPSWPSKEQLDYTQRAISVLLLTLALPWLAWKLLTNPGYVLAGAARQHVRPPA